MRVLIVDDEPLARNALVNIVSTRKDVEAVETADDAIAALDRLQEEPFDLLLLDIEMPETSGIEMLDALMKRNLPMPAVVFVTAYSQHAVAAFEKHAVDYVLKPFSEDRIHEAVNVAARRNEAERAAKLVSAMPDIGKAIRPSKKIAIKAKGKIIFIDPSEVMAAKAEGNYVLLQQQTGSHLVRESISTSGGKTQLLRLYPHSSFSADQCCVRGRNPTMPDGRIFAATHRRRRIHGLAYIQEKSQCNR